jgi:hypothetical protein
MCNVVVVAVAVVAVVAVVVFVFVFAWSLLLLLLLLLLSCKTLLHASALDNGGAVRVFVDNDIDIDDDDMIRIALSLDRGSESSFWCCVPAAASATGRLHCTILSIFFSRHMEQQCRFTLKRGRLGFYIKTKRSREIVSWRGREILKLKFASLKNDRTRYD